MKALANALALWTICVGFAAARGAAIARQAQTVPGEAVAAGSQTPAARLTLDASIVTVDALVTEKSGRVVQGLKSENFLVYDNGVPQTVVSLAPASEPMTVVILMEFSSGSYGYFAARAASWSYSFLDYLEPPDWAALVTFDMRPKVQVDFTRNRAEIRDALSTVARPSFRETNLYDAVIETLEMLDRVAGKKSILLVATGANTFSSSTLDDVIKRLRRTDTTIFCVGLAEIDAVRSTSPGTGYLQAQNALRTFAKMTGGLAMFPRFETELPDIFRSVIGFERNEYSLSFKIPQSARDGRYHRLRVEVVGADGKPLQVADDKGRRRPVEVYARQGYTAPRQ
ncbi:MAG: VWA domain-containing protein [Acidobacteriota bacterium]